MKVCFKGCREEIKVVCRKYISRVPEDIQAGIKSFVQFQKRSKLFELCVNIYEEY